MEKSALNSKRILYLDAISGIFILRMIYAHCCAASSVTNHDIIFLMTGLFLMWFFFKGGLLYSDKKKNIIRSSSRKLLKPFICFTAIGYGMDIAMYMIDKYIANFGGGYYTENEIVRSLLSIFINGSVHGNMPVWFLLSFFVVRVMFWKLSKLNIKGTKLFGVAIMALMIPYLLHFASFRYPYYIANTLMGLFGFILGYSYKNEGNNRVIMAVALAIYAFAFIFCPSTVDIRTNTLWRGDFLVWALWSVCGCISFIVLFSRCEWLTSAMQKLGICYIGRESMLLLCLHWPILEIAKFLIGENIIQIPQEYLLMFNCGAVVIFCPLLMYLFKKTKLNWIFN